MEQEHLTHVIMNWWNNLVPDNWSLEKHLARPLAYTENIMEEDLAYAASLIATERRDSKESKNDSPK